MRVLLLLGGVMALALLRPVRLGHRPRLALSESLVESTVDAAAGKPRLDAYLASSMPRFSRSYFADLCERGRVSVNAVARGKNHKLSAGDAVSVALEEKAVSHVAPEDIPLDVLFEDAHIIAVNKPAGMVVHPAVGSPNGTFVNALLFHLGPNAQSILVDGAQTEELEEELDLPETPEAAGATPPSMRPGIVHRLDKGTSGVLLAGKTLEAVAKLSALFAQRKIKKTYLSVNVSASSSHCLCARNGCARSGGASGRRDNSGAHRPVDEEQAADDRVRRPARQARVNARAHAGLRRQDQRLARAHRDGQVQLLACLCFMQLSALCRTHQIRVHLRHRHTPIVGDETYGNVEWNRKYLRSHAVRRPLLHAYETEFEHPFTGARVLITAPVPADMAALLTRLSAPLTPFFDEASALLTVTTEVSGKAPGETGRGFVPADRLVLEDELWTDMELPEDAM